MGGGHYAANLPLRDAPHQPAAAAAAAAATAAAAVGERRELLHPDTLHPLVRRQPCDSEPGGQAAARTAAGPGPWQPGEATVRGMQAELVQAGQRLSTLWHVLHDELNGRRRYSLL